jgi:isopentenyl-diphosphate delta-isomerase
MKDSVILVDENDLQYGTMEKHEAHKKGKLHRAFSIFIINDSRQLLLQKRAHTKYHSPGLWTNTCCSHPRPDENIHKAAKRRLMEEMGFDCKLEEKFSFIYKTAFNNQLIEHEYDHVFFGKYDKDPVPYLVEVAEWKWMDISEVSHDLKQNRQKYTYWFYPIWEKIKNSQDSFF